MIICISFNQITLARDLKVLEKYYYIEDIKLLDMFSKIFVMENIFMNF